MCRLLYPATAQSTATQRAIAMRALCCLSLLGVARRCVSLPQSQNFDDWHFPAEEPDELATAPQIQADHFNHTAGTITISVLAPVDLAGEQTLAVGRMAYNWTLRAVLPGSPPTAVLERSWPRWGALVYLHQPARGDEPSEWSPCGIAPQNPCTFLRTGVGQLFALRRPRYALTEADKDHFVKATTSTDDYLKQLFVNRTADHEPTFASAAAVCAPRSAGVYPSVSLCLSPPMTVSPSLFVSVSGSRY